MERVRWRTGFSGRQSPAIEFELGFVSSERQTITFVNFNRPRLTKRSKIWKVKMNGHDSSDNKKLKRKDMSDPEIRFGSYRPVLSNLSFNFFRYITCILIITLEE